MKRKILYWQATLVVPALVLAFSVQAHEPEKHMKEAEKPECAAMKTMDPSKMDRDDPVMQAMMQKCMDEMHQEESRPDGSHADHSGEDENGDVKRPSKHEH
ncbi:MAG: hypothetical protein CMK46_05855 [Porticoccus sp.]|jgi:hypothetical protein|nr:hypothetical protein [Porticoccus sp.]PHQ57664.1 MAG: hypothetical protein COA29_03075 [Porticoccus sp.]|tara:strand:- start:21516 stop:21818 length:303 start_codon:yes stop_codon:yes gene_type:complete